MNISRSGRPCMLMILDGWGIGASDSGDAVFLSQTPHLTRMMQEYPHTRLACSGEDVGLPGGIMGNSEVGHLNIGAGRIVYQDLLRIDMAIREGAFVRNPALKSVMAKVKARRSTLHLVGLVSDGGVHSQLDHLLALLDMAKREGLERACVHAILDGRDTPPDSGAGYVARLQEHMHAARFGEIASICGRYYAMDRDNRWERIERAFRLYTLGEGVEERDPQEAVKNAYLRQETDEFVRPVVMLDPAGKPAGVVRDDDGLVFFNFRADRAREITRAFTDPAFDFFARNPRPVLCEFVCMTEYDKTFPLPVAFGPVHLDGILGEVVSGLGLRQLRIAETEKYAHVTYFFNGGEEEPFALEDRCMIPSPRDIPTYDLKPEMSANEVAAEVLERIRSNAYDLIVLNFANMDMVGHTGVLEAAVRACRTVDACADEIVGAVKAQGGTVMITADHGNAEKMLDENGHVHTAHTLNPVPFVLVDDGRKEAVLRQGRLADIAPTILDVMGIEKPARMTGASLIADRP